MGLRGFSLDGFRMGTVYFFFGSQTLEHLRDYACVRMCYSMWDKLFAARFSGHPTLLGMVRMPEKS